MAGSPRTRDACRMLPDRATAGTYSVHHNPRPACTVPSSPRRVRWRSARSRVARDHNSRGRPTHDVGPGDPRGAARRHPRRPQLGDPQRRRCRHHAGSARQSNDQSPERPRRGPDARVARRDVGLLDPARAALRATRGPRGVIVRDRHPQRGCDRQRRRRDRPRLPRTPGAVAVSRYRPSPAYCRRSTRGRASPTSFAAASTSPSAARKRVSRATIRASGPRPPESST